MKREQTGWQWPLSPHNPHEREQAAQKNHWQIRRFSEHDLRSPYLLRKGMGHLQLWQPETGVSLLTPSRLTAGEWELDLPALSSRRRMRLVALEDVVEELQLRQLPPLPCTHCISRLYEGLVLAPMREILLLGGIGVPGHPIPTA